MSRSRYLSAISGLVVAGLALGSACCGGDTCGPGAAAPDGLELAGTGIDVHYSELAASSNHDCPDTVNAPPGITSLTISGAQSTGTFPAVFCIPRNDLLGVQGLALGTDVQIITLDADLGNGCTTELATTPAPTGTVTASGVCGDGTDHAGFALTFENGVVPIKRTCGSQIDVLSLALTGTVAIAGP